MSRGSLPPPLHCPRTVFACAVTFSAPCVSLLLPPHASHPLLLPAAAPAPLQQLYGYSPHLFCGHAQRLHRPGQLLRCAGGVHSSPMPSLVGGPHKFYALKAPSATVCPALPASPPPTRPPAIHRCCTRCPAALCCHCTAPYRRRHPVQHLPSPLWRPGRLCRGRHRPLRLHRSPAGGP